VACFAFLCSSSSQAPVSYPLFRRRLWLEHALDINDAPDCAFSKRLTELEKAVKGYGGDIKLIFATINTWFLLIFSVNTNVFYSSLLCH